MERAADAGYLPLSRGVGVTPWARRALRASLAALTLAPVGGGFAFVAAYGINAPFVDMWVFINDLLRERAGAFDWTELLKQHNEHRLVFPRIVLFALAGPFRLDDVPYMYVTELGFMLAAAAILWGVWRTFGRVEAVLVLGPFVAFLAFSYRQLGTMLLGFNMGFSFVEAFGALSLVLLYVAHGGRAYRAAVALAGAVAAALVASGSGIQGLMIWPSGLLLLVLLRPLDRRRVGAWLGLGVAVWVAYFWHYTQPPTTHAPFYGVVHPVAGLRFFATLIGSALAWDPTPSLRLGSVLLAVGIGAVLVAARRRARGAELWLALLVYAAAMCASIASGRSFVGGDAAVWSRYSTYALLYVTALFVLCAFLAWHRPTKRAVACVAALAVVIAWGADNTFRRGLNEGAANASVRRLGAFEVAMYRTEPDDALAAVYPVPGVIRRLAPGLERLHYSVFSGRRDVPPPLARVRHVGKPSACTIDLVNGERPDTTRTVTLSTGRDGLVSSGWCVDAAARTRAGGVYFVLDGRAQPAFIGWRRDDVAAHFHEPGYAYSGYQGGVRTVRLAPGSHTFAVIALSRDRRRAFAPTAPVRVLIR
jgi:hypothetical protein